MPGDEGDAGRGGRHFFQRVGDGSGSKKNLLCEGGMDNSKI